MDCDCGSGFAPPEFLLPPPPLPPFLSLGVTDSLCENDFKNDNMCASLMLLDSRFNPNLSSRISTIIAICTGAVVVLAILGLLLIAKCRQNMTFKKMNIYKNQNIPADQCVYTKNNNTNVSNYYEDIHEAQHIMHHNMTSIPTYHRPIIKPVAIHYYPNSLHRIDRRQPAYICRTVARPQNHYEDDPQYQDTLQQDQGIIQSRFCNNSQRYKSAPKQNEYQDNPGPIYEELDDNQETYADSENGHRESEDDFAEDELSSVDYKYPITDYYTSETLPLNRSIASHQLQNVQPKYHVQDQMCSHVNTFQRYPISQNNFSSPSRYFNYNNNPRIQGQKKVESEEITSDLECARSDDCENGVIKLSNLSDKKLFKNNLKCNAVSVHASRSLDYENEKELKSSRCDISGSKSDIKVGWKRGILLPETNQRFYNNGIHSLPYVISRTEQMPRRTHLNIPNTTYFNRPNCENGQDSSFGSDSGYSNHTQSSCTQNVR